MHIINCGEVYAQIVEEFMEEQALVCFNDGKGTGFNIRDSSTSCLDLTIVPGIIALQCRWEVLDQSTLGSDHFPIICAFGMEMSQ